MGGGVGVGRGGRLIREERRTGREEQKEASLKLLHSISVKAEIRRDRFVCAVRVFTSCLRCS
jgi:hypothetical protein